MSQIPKGDLAGFLTGIPSRPAPVQQTGFGSGMLNQMNRNVENMRNVGYRLRGEETPEARQAKALASLDLNTAEGLQKLAQAQRATGDLTGSVVTLQKAQAIAQQEAQKEAVIKLARQQGNTVVEDFVLNGGSVTKAQEVLLRSDRGTSVKTSSLTKGEVKQYDLYLDSISEDQLEKAGVDTPLFGKIRKDDKLRIYYNAEDLYTNRPELGREGALLEAIRQYGIAQQPESATQQSLSDSVEEFEGAPIDDK
tara:strand:+ start:482 stop:1237 length:756 start_codon:yes stop_codon:yes gene_type:complete